MLKLGKAQHSFQKGKILCNKEGMKGENRGRKAGGVGKDREEGKEVEERAEGGHISTQNLTKFYKQQAVDCSTGKGASTGKAFSMCW